MTKAPDHPFQGQDPASTHGANDEIRGLLTEAMARFADADRRNETLLREMHGQLETLRLQARDSRPSVPVPYRPGFERIEDGMALLASKIAETYATRPDAGHALKPAPDATVGLDGPSPLPAVAAPIANAFVANVAPIGYAALSALGLAAPDQGNQPPLRSSASGLARSPRFGKLSSHADTFDVIESVPGNPAEPWNQEEVAALNEIYSSRDMLFTHAGTEQGPPPAPLLEPTAPAAAIPRAPEASTPSTPFDHAWLDGRLAEIAGLIVEARPVAHESTAIDVLSERFAALEQHLTETLPGIARVEDMGALGQIESHIADLSIKIEQVHAEMAKFDGLELRLGEIETRVDAVRNEAGRSEGHVAHSAADIHAVAIAAAEAAAGRVAQQTARDQSRAQVPDRLVDVHDMLARYMAERRQGDEQTSAILDTLQQAMVHLLDRVDSHGVTAGQPLHAEPAYSQSSSHADQDIEGPHSMASDRLAPSAEETADDEFDEPHHEPAEPEPASAPRSKAGAQAEKVDYMADPIARQRASLQMSAQRAALAQREKQAALEAEAASNGKSRAIQPAPKPKATGWARLMVRGFVLAVAVGAGAGTVATLVPADAGLTTAQLKSGVSPAAAVVAEQNSSEQTLASISGEISRPSETVNSPVSAVISKDKPKAPAIMGIMIQDQPPQANPAGAPNRANGNGPAAGALKVSAAPGDAVAGGVSDSDDQSKSALGLPPATVGPVSLRLAAGNGDPSAEFEVAIRLAEGKGTDQNLALAARWYQRSASKGFVQAQYRLGTLYERGLGVTKDLNRAKSWYQRAAEQGNVKSMHNLAVLAAGRSEVAPDYDTAVKWFRSAAQNGLADSQYNLAVLTESGLGAAKDRVEAAQWYIIAARSGDRESIRRRDALRAQLTKAELSRAEAFAAAWQPLVPDRLANDSTVAGQAWKSRQPGAEAQNNG